MSPATATARPLRSPARAPRRGPTRAPLRVIPARMRTTSSGAFAVTGTHLSTDRTRAAVEQAFRWARKNGTRCVLDIDYRPVLWKLTAAGDGASRFVASETVTASMQPLIPLCDLVVGTEEEIRIAGGTEDVIAAIRRIRSTGVEIRMQAPLVRRVNDRASTWARMWREGVKLGLIPYYMFVERDTGPKNYFEVPLARAYQIFREAYQHVSGLARTVRGPSMSATQGKVKVSGVQTVAGEKVFLLEFLQARNPLWVKRPFFARFDPRATWFDQLRPAFGEDHFFFDGVRERDEEERRLLTMPVAV